MKRTVNTKDIFNSPIDNTAQDNVLALHRDTLAAQLAVVPSEGMTSAIVKSYAYAGEEADKEVRTVDVQTIIYLNDTSAGLLVHMTSLGDACAELYQSGNPDRITIITEIIEED